MHRRALLKGLLAVGAPAAAAAAAAATVRARTAISDTTEGSLKALQAQFEELKRRFEQTDARSKRLTKAALALAALSLGMDVTALL